MVFFFFLVIGQGGTGAYCRDLRECRGDFFGGGEGGVGGGK